MQETQGQSLGQEDSLEKKIAIHFNILAWEIPWTEEPGGLQSVGSQRVRHNWENEHLYTRMLAKTFHQDIPDFSLLTGMATKSHCEGVAEGRGSWGHLCLPPLLVLSWLPSQPLEISDRGRVMLEVSDSCEILATWTHLSGWWAPWG